MSENVKKIKKMNPSIEVLKRLFKNKFSVLGLVIILFIVLMALTADLFFDYNEVVIKINLKNASKPPSLEHPFGTDSFGRDILARIAHGSKISLLVGVVSVSISLLIGGTLGSVAGYFGKRVEEIIMRLMDVLLAVPSILLAIAIVSAFGPNLLNLMIAIGISSIPGYARIMRSSVLTVRDQEFIEAARACGGSDLRIILKHAIPNSLAPVIVQSTLGIAGAILATSGLSFIGLGIPVPKPEWGNMLSEGRMFLRVAPHITIIPGITIVITILAFNFLGDGLRDALDPKLKR